MVYQLTAPTNLPPLPDIFAHLPPQIAGLQIWLAGLFIAVVYAILVRRREAASPAIPLLLATIVYTGLFINKFHMIDEVAINLEHPWNLFHHGRFSMSPVAWTEGTVEFVFYLLHTPFGWSQESLVTANYGISWLVGWLHLPLAWRILGARPSPARNTLLLSAFACCVPLIVVLATGFGNGLVSLMFVAAIAAAVRNDNTRAITIAGLLPLLRPDAIFLAAVNGVVITAERWIRERRLLNRHEIGLLIGLPLLSTAIYYSLFRIAFGHWMPTPIFFKAFKLPMLEMTNWPGFGLTVLTYFLLGVHLIGAACICATLLAVARRREVAGGRAATLLAGYAIGTLPLLLVYAFTRNTIGDFSFLAYARYWIAFEVTLLLLAAVVLGNADRKSPLVGPSILLGMNLFFALLALTPPSSLGRTDNVSAGALTQRYLAPGLTLSTTEMNTFGLMIDRPVIDLWGYTTPEIAHSKVCNADRIRNNPEYFLSVKPDVYWPYQFSGVLDPAVQQGTYYTAEESLATFHHSSKQGNLLGDMTKVLAEYDMVVVQFGEFNLGYLVRAEKRDQLIQGFLNNGFRKIQERKYHMDVFRYHYERPRLITHRCG